MSRLGFCILHVLDIKFGSLNTFPPKLEFSLTAIIGVALNVMTHIRVGIDGLSANSQRLAFCSERNFVAVRRGPISVVNL